MDQATIKDETDERMEKLEGSVQSIKEKRLYRGIHKNLNDKMEEFILFPHTPSHTEQMVR